MEVRLQHSGSGGSGPSGGSGQQGHSRAVGGSSQGGHLLAVLDELQALKVHLLAHSRPLRLASLHDVTQHVLLPLDDAGPAASLTAKAAVIDKARLSASAAKTMSPSPAAGSASAAMDVQPWREVVAAIDVDRGFSCLSIRCRDALSKETADTSRSLLLQEETLTQLHAVTPEQALPSATIDIRRGEVPLARVRQILRRHNLDSPCDQMFLIPMAADTVLLLIDSAILLLLNVSHTHVNAMDCVRLSARRPWASGGPAISAYTAGCVVASAHLYLLSSEGTVDVYDLGTGLHRAFFLASQAAHRPFLSTLSWNKLAVNSSQTHLTMGTGWTKPAKSTQKSADPKSHILVLDIALYQAQHPSHRYDGAPSGFRTPLTSQSTRNGSASRKMSADLSPMHPSTAAKRSTASASAEHDEEDESDESSTAGSDEDEPLNTPAATASSGTAVVSSPVDADLLRQARGRFTFDLAQGVDQTWQAEQRQIVAELRRRDPMSDSTLTHSVAPKHAGLFPPLATGFHSPTAASNPATASTALPGARLDGLKKPRPVVFVITAKGEQVVRLSITSQQIVAAVGAAQRPALAASAVMVCSLTTQELQRLSIASGAIYLSANPVLLLRETGVSTVVFNTSQRALLDNLIMLDRADLADQLCDLNGWDHHSLSTHQLETGLRYRQLDVVARVLDALDNNKLEYTCSVLLENVRSVWSFTDMSGQFPAQLLRLSLNFVAKKLEEGAQLRNIPASVMACLAQCMTELRAFRAARQTDAKGSTAGNTAAAAAPVVPGDQLQLADSNPPSSCYLLRVVEKTQGIPSLDDSIATAASEVLLPPAALLSSLQQLNHRSFEFFKKWSNMTEGAILKDALSNNALMQAQIFFQLRRRLLQSRAVAAAAAAAASSEAEDLPAPSGPASVMSPTSAAVREVAQLSDDMQQLFVKHTALGAVHMRDTSLVARNLAFVALTRGDVEEASRLLTNVGLDPQACLEEAFFHTCRPALRGSLQSTLQSKGWQPSSDIKSALDFLDQLEAAYPCQTADTALKLRRPKKSRKVAGVPMARLPGADAALQSASSVLGSILVRKSKNTLTLACASLSDVAGDWLAKPLQAIADSLNVDAEQELFYAGNDSMFYSQAPLAFVLPWSTATRHRVLEEGDGKATPLVSAANVAAVWASRVDRCQVDRLPELTAALQKLLDERGRATVMKEFAFLFDASSADAYTRRQASVILGTLDLFPGAYGPMTEPKHIRGLLRPLARSGKMLESSALSQLPEAARHAAVKFIILRCRELHLDALCSILLNSNAAGSLPNATSLLRSAPDPWMVLLGLEAEYAAGRMLADFSQVSFRHHLGMTQSESFTFNDLLANADASLELAVAAHAVYSRQPLASLVNHPQEEWQLSAETVQDSFSYHPWLQRLILNSQQETLASEAPSQHIVYRLLSVASSLRVGPALKWQLDRICAAVDGPAKLTDAERDLREQQDLDPTFPFVRHQLPFCGGEFAQRFAQEEALDFTFYLQQGRPLYALQMLGAEQRQEWDGITLPTSELLRVYTLGLRRRAADTVAAACVLFFLLINKTTLATWLKEDIRALCKLDAATAAGPVAWDASTLSSSAPVSAAQPTAAAQLAGRSNSMSRNRGGSVAQSAADDYNVRLLVSLADFRLAAGSGVRAPETMQRAVAALLSRLSAATLSLLKSGPRERPRSVSNASAVSTALSTVSRMDPQPIVDEDVSADAAEAWSLVCRLCRRHGEPLDPTYIIMCAERNAWLPLLTFAQAEQFPPAMVLDIVEQYCPLSPVRLHLQTVLYEALQPRALQATIVPSSQSPPHPRSQAHTSAEGTANHFVLLQPHHTLVYTDVTKAESSGELDLFDILWWCRHQTDVPAAMLAQAAARRQPMLALVAVSARPAAPTLCALVWLFASLPAQFAGSQSTAAALGVVCFAGLDVKMTGPAATSEEVALQNLRELLGAAVSAGCFSTAATCFALFDPSSPLSNFFSSLAAWHAFDLPTTERLLGLFKSSVGNLTAAGLAKIGSADWMSDLATELLFVVVRRCPTQDELGHLLKIVARLKYNDRFERLHRAFEILGPCNMDVDIDTEASEVVKELVRRKLFEPAKQLSGAYGLSLTPVLIAEAQYKVDTTLRSPLAKTPSARKVLVEQCELLLGSTHCDPINAARFFINLATGAAQQHFTLAERIVILGIASKCLHLLETDAARRLFTTTEHQLWSLRITHEARLQEQLESTNEGLQEQERTSKDAAVDSAAGDGTLAVTEMLDRTEAGVRGWGTGEVSSPLELPLQEPNAEAVCPLSPAEVRAWQRLLSQLLSKGALKRALSLAASFNYYHPDLVAVQVVYFLAQEMETPGRLAAVAKKHLNVDISNQDVPEAILSVMDGTTLAQMACRRIRLNFLAARTLNMSLKAMQASEALKVLRFLLQRGPDCFDMCRDLVQFNSLNTEGVAQVLAETYLDQVIQATSATTAGQLWTAWDEPTFTQFVSLVEDTGVVGRKLLATVQDSASMETLDQPQMSDAPDLTVAAEVDLLIRAHVCFRLVCAMDGLAAVRAFIKTRAQHFAKKREFKALAKLLTGLKLYREQEYILDILYDNDQFETILSAKSLLPDRHDQTVLHSSLQDYLKRRHPEDTASLEMLSLAFSVFYDIGMNRMERAKAVLSRAVPAKLSSPKELLKDLDLALQMLQEAAQKFAQENSAYRTRECLLLARLVGLQAQVPFQLLHLQREALDRRLNHHPRFGESLIIAQAYGRDSISNWVTPVYYQVVCHGNLDYLVALKQHLMTPTTFFVDVVNTFIKRQVPRDDPEWNTQVNNVKNFLEECDDVITRYNLAVQINSQTGTAALRQYSKQLLAECEYLRDFMYAKSRRRTASTAPSPRR